MSGLICRLQSAFTRSSDHRPSVGRIAGGLATLGLALGLAVVQLGGGLPAQGAGPAITLSPASGQPGSTVTVRGTGFPSADDGWVFWDGVHDGMPEVATDRRGSFSTSLTIPNSTAATHTIKVVISGATARAPFTVSASATAQPAPSAGAGASPPTSSAGVVWQADMETGNLGQWTAGNTRGGSYDSGDCQRPPSGVTTQAAHSGRYSMQMTADTSSGQSGCRQFRQEESEAGGAYFYSAWMMIPKQVSVTGNFWSIFQFKSQVGSTNEAFWVVEAANRPNGTLHPILRYKGLVAGPTAGEGTGVKYYDQALKDIPIGRWFHLETYLRQSDRYDGQITVWMDGAQLWDFSNVRTKYDGGDNRWSVNSYSDGVSGNLATVYVDDAKVSRTRVGPS